MKRLLCVLGKAAVAFHDVLAESMILLIVVDEFLQHGVKHA